MRAVITAALVVCGVVVVLAQTTKCGVCGKPIIGKFYNVEDRAHGGQVEVCDECAKLESRCFACSLPVTSNAIKLTDGRFLCARDAKEAIQSDEEAKKVCFQTRDMLDQQCGGEHCGSFHLGESVQVVRLWAALHFRFWRHQQPQAGR
jgi:hypothetical protein